MSFQLSRRTVIASAALASGGFAWGQAFPSKPIRILVGAAAGGGSDNITRKVVEIMTRQTNANIVVENRPGASGSISVLATIRSPADGYTLTICPPDTVAVYPQLKKVPPYTANDLTPIAKLAEVNFIFVVPASSPANNVAEFLRYARAQPKPLSFGSNGVGTSARMVTELFKQRTGLQMEQIPYQGDTPMLTAMSSGETAFASTAFISAKAFLDGGRIKAIGLIADQRNPDFPNVPTVAESGLTNFNVSAWFGIFGPANMPPDVTKKLGEMFMNAVNTDEFRQWAKSRGLTPSSSGPVEFSQYVKENIPLWSSAIKGANITLED